MPEKPGLEMWPECQDNFLQPPPIEKYQKQEPTELCPLEGIHYKAWGAALAFKAKISEKIKKEETKINWNLDANKVLAHIHALSPSPGAWFEFENERFKVLKAKIITMNGKVANSIDENLTIACGSNSIQILELQRQGKKKQTSKEFLLGKKIKKNSLLI